MSPYLALIIPFIGTIIVYIFHKEKLSLFESIGISAISLLLIFSIEKIAENSIKSDTDVYTKNGYKIKYYEYYETWVEKRCSRTICTGSGKSRTCHTQYYDCSYCDKNSARYVLVDKNDNLLRNLTKKEYDTIKKRWNKSKETFVDLHRNINKNGYCGQDGDMYYVAWDKNPYTTEAVSISRNFVNPIKGSRSAFKFNDISKEDAVEKGLFEYPKYDHLQPTLLGYKGHIPDSTLRLFDYMNGKYGETKKINIVVLFFYNKDISTAIDQESYWNGGKDNELVVCINLDDKNNITWVYPFSWCKEKMLVVDIRENLMSIDTKLNHQRLFNIINSSVSEYLVTRDFEEFGYLKTDLPTSVIVTIFIVITLATIGMCYYSVVNEFDSEIHKK